MGLIINKPLGSLTMGELFAQLDIEPSAVVNLHPVHFGGPVEAGRGFVLHTADYREEFHSPCGRQYFGHGEL